MPADEHVARPLRGTRDGRALLLSAFAACAGAVPACARPSSARADNVAALALYESA